MLNDSSLPTSSDGMNITRDTSTNLEWLDLTVTTGSSFNDVSAQLTAGGTLDGFRFATTSEVAALWSSFGFSPGFDGNSSNPEILTAVTFLGNTFGVSAAEGFNGLYDDSGTGNDPTRIGWARAFVVPSDPRWQADINDDNRLFSQSTGDTGAYIVRSVPEPSSILFFVTFTLPLTISRRRRITMG